MPAKYTIEFTSGGNHGHQLKDYFGGRTVGELFGLEYRATKHKYLRDFGVEKNVKSIPIWKRRFLFRCIVPVQGPNWDGFDNYEDFRCYFEKKIDPAAEDTLYVFKNAVRVHPCQTISWYKSGIINKNICGQIVNEATFHFGNAQPSKGADLENISVAVHINRGSDFNQAVYPEHFSSSKNVRYIFPLEYYANIIENIKKHYSSKKVRIDIYTETLNSEPIVKKFKNINGVHINLGQNRDRSKNGVVMEIFNRFIEADILVSSNSSFSSVASYFRGQKTTIYHPHKHLHSLEYPNYIATKIDGSFDITMLP